MKEDIKRRENKVRRQLAKQGLALRKSRVSIFSADDKGGYRIIDMQFNRIEAGERFELTLEEVEAFVQD